MYRFSWGFKCSKTGGLRSGPNDLCEAICFRKSRFAVEKISRLYPDEVQVYLPMTAPSMLVSPWDALSHYALLERMFRTLLGFIVSLSLIKYIHQLVMLLVTYIELLTMSDLVCPNICLSNSFLLPRITLAAQPCVLLSYIFLYNLYSFLVLPSLT